MGAGSPRVSDLILLAKASKRSYYEGDLQEISRSFPVSREALFCITPFCVHSEFSGVFCLERLTPFGVYMQRHLTLKLGAVVNSTT